MAERAVERRIVTVLFADLVGFTALSELLDAEDVTLVQDAYFEATRETVTRYGGLLEKFVGDAVMAVFGAPRSRDDDAERAVRAGLALVSSVERLDAKLGFAPGTLQLRVGVNSGEAVYGEATAERGPVTGDTVNVAARLQAAASPGSVVVGEVTALAVADTVELAALAPLELKGKAEPVAAWRVVDLFAERSRERALGSMRAPTIGRDEELRRLRVLVGRTDRVVIVAPPGVGKTRVLSELARSAADGGALVLTARLRPDLLSPFEPVAQLLRSGGGDPDVLAERLRAAGTEAGRAAVVAQLLAAVSAPDAGVEVERDQLFAAWLEGLDALAGNRAVLWLVEDVHWGSRDLRAFLDVAGRAPRAAGRLVVVTARPVLFEHDANWVDTATRLDLPPLGEVDTSRLVRALVGNSLPPSLVESIAERSGGNALFVEELLRMWVSAGALVPDGEEWRLAAPAEAVVLPPTVQAIYAGQLDDLPTAARIAARRAAVAGRRFPVAALESLNVPRGAESVQTLTRRDLLAGPLDDPLLGESYAYRHALLRDAGYASLSRAERAVLHVRFADWLASHDTAVRPALAEVIARHYAAALESAPQLVHELNGLPLAAVRDAAAGWFEDAARIAIGLAAWDSAAALAGKAVELTRPDQFCERARRRQLEGEATANATGVAVAIPLLHESIEGFRRAHEQGEAAARRGLADAGWSLGNLLRSQTLFQAVEDLANELLAELGGPEDVAVAKLLTLRALGALNARDDVVRARPDAVRAHALARSAGDRTVELDALQVTAQIDTEDGVSAEGIWEEVAELARERRRWDIVCGALRTRSGFLEDDDPREALRFIDDSADVANAHGLVEAAGWNDYARAEAYFCSGDWDAALAAGLRAIELGEARDFHRVVVRTWFVLRPLALARGRTDLIEQAFPRFAARVGVEPDSPYARIVSTAMHLTFAELGLEPSFVPSFEERLQSLDLEHTGPSWLAAIESVVDCWIDADELSSAQAALDRIRARLGRGRTTRLATATEAILRSRLLLARHEPDEAARECQRALATAAPWWRVKAIRELERAGRASPALLEEATAVSRELGLDVCSGS